MIILTLSLLLASSLNGRTEANSTHVPRMRFTDKGAVMKRSSLSGQHAPLWIIQGGEPDTVTAVGQRHLISFDFQSPQTARVERPVLWNDCTSSNPPKRDCNYNITVVHEREEANQLLLCGVKGRETLCCDVNLSEQSPACIPSANILSLRSSIQDFPIKEGEASVLVESAGNADLYITYSGSQVNVGIHKFGRNRVEPAYQDKEQHYVGLVLSRRPGRPVQDRVYGFYREKNRDTSLYSEMWLPFVTQVCTSDIGGPKNYLQFTWTSQMNARLFCGDAESKQHFSELVDVATVHADRWQDTRVYALFRNEWGMSAVCAYTIQDIDTTFTNSQFKDNQVDRPRMCVRESTKIHLDILEMIKKASEMQEWVRPVNNSGPLLFNHHSYSHIYVDGSQQQQRNNHPVLFLSLNNGGIHKVINHNGQTFIIAEYRPFTSRTHVLGLTLRPTSRKLYVNYESELVQLDVANCGQYGDSCEQCVLARDPYCGWDGTRCTDETHGTVQDVAGGDHTICKPASGNWRPEKAFRSSTEKHADEHVDSIRLPSRSKYFLQCPMSSHHAQYTWHQPENSTSCSQREEQCLLLIDSMSLEQVGTYTCVSEEMGYSRVLAQYRLQLDNRATGHSSSPLLWVCLMAVLIKSLSFQS